MKKSSKKRNYKKDRGSSGFFSNTSFRGSYKKFGGKWNQN